VDAGDRGEAGGLVLAAGRDDAADRSAGLNVALPSMTSWRFDAVPAPGLMSTSKRPPEVALLQGHVEVGVAPVAARTRSCRSRPTARSRAAAAASAASGTASEPATDGTEESPTPHDDLP